jgi:hypothetical protein
MLYVDMLIATASAVGCCSSSAGVPSSACWERKQHMKLWKLLQLCVLWRKEKMREQFSMELIWN